MRREGEEFFCAVVDSDEEREGEGNFLEKKGIGSFHF